MTDKELLLDEWLTEAEEVLERSKGSKDFEKTTRYILSFRNVILINAMKAERRRSQIMRDALESIARWADDGAIVDAAQQALKEGASVMTDKEFR
jgi:hypothetical protein